MTSDGEMMTQDLISEILLRLPVKSLLRCKSVCKPWLSLISSPNFIISQLRHATTKPGGADETLIVYQRDDNSMSLLNLDSPLNKIPLGFPYSRGDYSFDPDYKIVGSYNGIVCVSVSNCPRSRSLFDFGWFMEHEYYLKNRNTYLWNPATKHSKLIPPHNLRNGIMSTAVGFGFDPIANDYKVVRIVSLWDKPRSAEVYSVNTNVWRKVKPCHDFLEHGDYDFSVPEDFPEYDEFDVCVNGFLCCLGFYGMMAFDLNNEVFTCGNPVPVKSSDYCFTDFNHSIAVITSNENELNHIFNLWTLDDDTCLRGGRVKASWTLKLSIDVQYPDPRVYGCFNSGDFLLCTEDYVQLLYNSHNKKARTVPVSITIGRRIIKYNESLVIITGSKQVDWNAHEDDS